MYSFVWLFFIYAFLGWCSEVSYAALTTGRFINRGFLNGPLCPIYGFGMLIVLFCLNPLRHNLLLLFFGSVLLTSALELATGVALEKLFRQHWWDYSDKPFHLGGYICLQFSVLWGLACLFVVQLLHPSIEFFVGIIPVPLGWTLLAVFIIFATVDLTATVATIAKINRQLSQIDELAAKIKAASNEFGEGLADTVLDAAEKGAEWKLELDSLAGSLSERKDEFEDVLTQRAAELREELDSQRDQLEDAMFQKKLEFYDGLDELRENMLEWKDKLQALLDSAAFGQRRLIRAFPRMRSTRHHQALQRLRRRMQHHHLKGK